MKKIVSSILVTVIVVMSLACIVASAASSEAVSSVHFDLYPNSDGSVDVTETWNIEYSGTGEGFTRWIDTNENGLSDVQKYDSVTDIKVAINGVSVTEKSSELNYFQSGNSADLKSYNIVVISPSATETKEYTISYTVNGAIKKQGNNIRVAYMLIGNAFEYTCNNVTTTIHLPEGVAASDVTLNDESDVLINNNTVDYNTGRVYTTFGVDITVPSDGFDTSVMVSYSEFGNTIRNIGQALLDVIFVIIIIVTVAAVIVFTLFYENIRRFSIEKKLKKTARSEVSAISGNISACKAYKMLVPYSRVNPKATSKKIPSLFAMAILECIENGYIVQKDDELIVGIPESENDAYIMSVLNFLITFCEKKGNRYVITSDFGEKIKAECMTNYDSVANYLCSFYELVPEMDSKFLKNEDNCKLYENSFVLKNIIRKENCKCTFAQGIDAVFNGAKTCDKQIFAMMFTGKIFDSDGRNCISALAEAVGAMYDVLVKSK